LKKSTGREINIGLEFIREDQIMKRVHFLVCATLAICVILGAALGERTTALFEQPILLTSAGQSADVQLASVLIKKAGLNCTLVKTATEKDLEGHKTLVLVLGASLKGLGAAGLDTNKEKNRLNDLLKAAESEGIPLFCLHLGGAERRGQTTDEIVNAYLPHAKLLVMVKSGNQDGLFTKICSENSIPLIEVEKTIETMEPIKKAFK